MALILRAEALRGRIDLAAAIDAVADAYRALVEVPAYGATRQRILHADRRLTVHPGASLPHRAAGLFVHYERLHYHAADQAYGGVGQRVYVVYDSESAELLAVILGSLPLFPCDGDDELFGTETALTSAVGTRALARPDSRIMALLGTGRQARRHLLALAPSFPLREVRVFSRSAENRAAFVARMQGFVDVPLRATTSAKDAVAGADLVVCATGSNLPVLDGAWLAPGAHVTSIVNSSQQVVREGQLAKTRRELDDATVARADRVVVVLRDQAIQDGQGDLAEPVAKGLLSWDKVDELGPLLAGRAPGRTSAGQITLFKQNSDQGVGFMALGRLAYDLAMRDGLGARV